jgi:hypothetical protein
MSPNIILIAALAIPLAVLTLLRINAAMVFLSLCLGDVLVAHVAQDQDSLISFLTPHTGSVSAATIQLIILLLPAVITSVIMLLSVHGKVRVIANILPAAGVAFLGVLLVVPLLTPGLRYSIQGEALWQQLARAQALIIGISAFMSMVFLWAHRRHTKKLGDR